MYDATSVRYARVMADYIHGKEWLQISIVKKTLFLLLREVL